MRRLSDIDKLSRFYFDRTFNSYSSAINKVIDNFAFNELKQEFNQMDSSLNTLDKVFRLELAMFIIDDPVKR